MILTTSPATARFIPTVREFSRAGDNAVQGVGAARNAQEAESGLVRPQPATDRVEPTQESNNVQQTRNATDRLANNALSEEDRGVLEQLKRRDREVRAHEAAHLAAAGRHATSGASFSYQRGPDGQLYAIGGEVGVDVSKVAGDPQATLAKAEQVRAAALAPASPSSQDRAIAARASQLAAQARREIASEGVETSTDSASATAEVEPGEGSDSEAVSANPTATQLYDAVSTDVDEQVSRLLDVQA